MTTESGVRALAQAIGADVKALLSGLAGKAALNHASRHAAGQPDAVTPAAIGAADTGHSHAAAAPAAHASSHGPAGSDSLAVSYIARTLLSAKGLFPVAQSGSVVTAQPAGAEGQVLTWRGASGTGLAWEAPAAGGTSPVVAAQRPELLTDWRGKANGPIPATGDEGTPITVATSAVGVPQPVVSGGGVVFPGTGAIYLNQPLANGRKTRMIGAEWTIPTAGTVDNGAMALCAFLNVAISPQRAHIHVAIGREGWAVQFYDGVATNLRTGSFVPPLAVGTAEHRAEVVVYGDVLRVTLPDGTYVETPPNANVESIQGLIGSWEILQTADSPTFKLHQMWAHPYPTLAGEVSESRAGRIARRALPWLYDEITGNVAWKAAPAPWADFFVAGMIGSNSFFALDEPTLDGHLTKRSWVLAQVAAGSPLVTGGGSWDAGVHGDLVSTGHRDDATAAYAMSASIRSFLLLLGRVPAGKAITGVRMARSVAQTGGAMAATLYSNPTLGGTAWTYRGQTTAVPIAGTGQVQAALAVAAQPTDLWYAVVLTNTGTTTAYPTWLASPQLPAAAAGLINVANSVIIAGFSISSTVPTVGAALNPTTGFTVMAQKPWCALY